MALGHLSYTVVVRPYRERLEQALSVINAVIVVSIAVCALWTRVKSSSSGGGYGDGSTTTIATVPTNATATTPSTTTAVATPTLAMGYCLLAANGFFFVQLIVLTVSATLHECRRRGKAGGEDGGLAAVTSPLLLVLPSVVANDQDQHDGGGGGSYEAGEVGDENIASINPLTTTGVLQK